MAGPLKPNVGQDDQEDTSQPEIGDLGQSPSSPPQSSGGKLKPNVGKSRAAEPPLWTPDRPQSPYPSNPLAPPPQVLTWSKQPPQIDTAAQMVDLQARVITMMDQEPAFRQVMTMVRSDLGGTVTMPELLSTMVGTWEQDPDMWREMLRLREEEDQPMQEAYMNAFLNHGPVENVVEALYTNLPNERSALDAMNEDGNLSILLTETNGMFNADNRDLVAGIFSGIPAQMKPKDNRPADSTPRGTFMTGMSLIGFDPGQAMEGVADPRYYRNGREELATMALHYLEDNPLDSEDAQRKFIVWLYMNARQTTKEIEGGGTSGISQLLNVLDIPKRGTTEVANHVLYGMLRPGDHFDRTAQSFGKNLAMSRGLNPGDSAGSSILNNPALQVLTKPLQYGINIIPLVAAASEFRVAFTDEGPIQTPFIGGLIEGMENSNTYQLASGATDLLTWFVFDPVNWATAAGFGVKQARQVTRLPQLNRAQQAWRSIIPFFGARSTGVRGGFLTQLSWSFASRTADDMLREAPKMIRGKNLYKAFFEAEHTDDIVRRFKYVDGNQAALLMSAAQEGEDSFWGMLRMQMVGPMDPGSPGNRHVMSSLLATKQQNAFSGAGEMLRQGRISIRQAAQGAFGSKADEVFEAVSDAGFFNEAVTSSVTRKLGDRADQGTELGRATLKNGTEIRVVEVAAGNVAAYTDEGELVGGISRFLSDNPDVATVPQWRRQGVMNALKSFLPAEGRAALEGAVDTGSGAFRVAMGEAPQGWAGGVAGEVFRRSANREDGLTKAVINGRAGWRETKLGSRATTQLVQYLDNAGDTELAAKVAIAGDEVLSSLSADEVAKVQNWMMTQTDLYAITNGDEAIFAPRAERRMLVGADSILDDMELVQDVLKDELYDAAVADSIRPYLDNTGGEVAVINRMPTTRVGAEARQNLTRWARLDGKSRTAQFFRKFGENWRSPVPVEVDPTKPQEGRNSLNTWMRMIGVSPDTRAAVLDEWDKAASTEQRWRAFHNNLGRMGEDIDDPFLKYGLYDFYRRHGERIFARTTAGDEVGMYVGADGSASVKPPIRALKTESIPLPNALEMQRTLGRYRMGSKFPRLTGGLRRTGTRGKREDLAGAYRAHVRRVQGDTVANALADEDLIAMAYADVIGFEGRASGLGRINDIGSMAASGYKVFHTLFTYGQLALRPFAWATRVNLEEQTRGWLMGLPSLFQNPSLYFASQWDAWFWAKRPKHYEKQTKAALNAADRIFAAGTPDNPATLKAVLEKADEILPGFSAKVKARKITNKETAQALFSRDLTNALKGGVHPAHLGRRSNVTRRIIARSSALRVHTERLEKIYSIGPDDILQDTVPEIANKLHAYLFADELASSVQRLTFNPDVRPGDVPDYGAEWLNKASQYTTDQAGKYAINRTLEQMDKGSNARYTGAKFVRTSYWDDNREDALGFARYHGESFGSEAELADWYLDFIVRDNLIDTHFGGLWVGNPAERRRIYEELRGGRLDIARGDRQFSMSLDRHEYANSKSAAGRLFDNLYREGNFDFPDLGGVVNPMMGNRTQSKNFARKLADEALQRFGEDISQVLHRRPSYLAERRRWLTALNSLGWEDEAASVFAHQKAFEMTNYTFFNNQHTGATAHRLNKIIPFFSAWLEVAGTWAYKIPSQNFLPLGYVNMAHKVDRALHAFTVMGLIEQDENGQWHMNLSDDPNLVSPAGEGLSKGGYELMSAPRIIIETLTNIGRFALSAVDDDFQGRADFSEWSKDNYSIAVGSPVHLNSHGIMGVNQFQFGLNPALGFAVNHALMLAPFAGDTQLIQGDTMEDVISKLPADISTAEFYETNATLLREKLGPDKYNLLWGSGGTTADLSQVDTSGLALQVPRSSWFDTVIDEAFFPFGREDTKEGVIRSITPSSLGYVIRSLTGLFLDESPWAEGISSIFTGPMEQYQIDSEVNRQLIMTEAEEGYGTRSRSLSEQINQLVAIEGYGSIGEYFAAVEPGSPESAKLTDLMDQLEENDNAWMKRATDRAMFVLLNRGLMGFAGPASPRMTDNEQNIITEFYTARDMAENARLRGDVDWGEAMRNVDVRDYEDILRISALVNEWYEDPTGSQAKGWFMQNYPNLMAFTQGVSFYGPAGQPAAQRDIDTFFEDVDAGRRQGKPAAVMQQHIMRAAASGSREGEIRQAVGSNDPVEQALWFLNNPIESRELREKYRMRTKALDMLDEELYHGEYDEWRKRNQDDSFTFFQEAEEQYYAMQDVFDDVIALSNVSELSADQQKEFRSLVGQLNREFGDAFRELQDTLTGENPYLSERDRVIGEYYLQVADPYYTERQVIFEEMDAMETREEISNAWERMRDLDNSTYTAEAKLEWNGEEYTVPNVLERNWLAKDENERTADLLVWLGRNPEWLSLFNAAKLTESFPSVESYLPQSIEDAELYREATMLRNEAIAYSRANPGEISKYERDQYLQRINTWLRSELESQGRGDEATFLDAWPVERLIYANQLPQSLADIAGWYLGIKADLESQDPPKGPSSEYARVQFNALVKYLEETYYFENPQALEDIDDLGYVMFETESRQETYARLYGIFFGELD